MVAVTETNIRPRQGLLQAATDFTQVPKMDVIVIAVPTPLTRNLNPDLQYVENVTRELSRYFDLVTLVRENLRGDEGGRASETGARVEPLGG